MRKVRYAVAVFALGFSGSVLAVASARNVVAAQDAAAARVVILPIADGPITLDAARVATNPSNRLAFTATNTGPKKVRDYTVSVFWFPPAGQPHGFVNLENEPSANLGKGDAQAAVMPLSDRLRLGSDTTLIVAVRSATFDDGSEWRADDINARVNEKARELKLQ
jgi:hypothetical protein